MRSASNPALARLPAVQTTEFAKSHQRAYFGPTKTLFQGVESVRKQRKISVTVSPELVADLDNVAGRLGVSRSAIISELLAAPVSDMRAMLDQLPLNPTPADVVRFRGASAEVVRDRLSNLQGIADDLLSDA